MPGPELTAALECELPERLEVGGGTALFVCGWCVSALGDVRDLALALGDGPRHPVAAQRMPRLDPFRALHPGLDPYATAGLDRDPGSDADPGLHAYRSGFWGLVPVSAATARGPAALTLHGELTDGTRASAVLHRLEIVPDPFRPRPVAAPAPSPAAAPPAAAPPAAAPPAPAVVIAIAVHEPPEDLLRVQLDSIRAQTITDWTCVISDDCSGPDGAAVLRGAVADDPRFSVSRAPRRLGFYRNFERALSLVPSDARFVALSDQDDAWHPDKLATLLAAIGDAQLVHSDARVVDRDGTVVSPTWWSTRTENADDPFSLLVANSVTGAASLMRAEVLDDALPFPPAQFAHFHDHWLGLVARCRGEVRFVDRPLFDYVQHGEASLGHAAANRMPSLGERLRTGRALRERVALWRMHYFVDVWRLRTLAAILELRLGPRLDRRSRRALGRLAAAEASWPALAALALRGARDLRRERSRTLGAEWMLAHALAWRRLLALTARERPQRRLRLDALAPTTLAPRPGVVGLPEGVRRVADKIAPLRFAADPAQPQRVNLLIPTIDLDHLFAGYIAKFNLAARLAARGVRVRILTTDPVGPLPPDHRARVEAYAGLAGLWDRVELAFGRESGEIAVHPHDRFVASTWWTAHIAADAVAGLGGGRFAYLIQEYEPCTFAAGTWAALARESYDFDHAALFSSDLLRGYFRAHAIGAYAEGSRAGDARSRAFENAITDVSAPAAADLRRAGPRRLLFYARPEDHAARNMFDLGVLALARAVARGAFRGGWELHGIGSVRGGARTLSLGDATLTLLPRTGQSDYAAVLRGHDVGLALMDTPHPSLVPIEMAAAGMVTVTTTFENKTPEALAAISPNIVGVPPTVGGVADALLAAAAAAGDHVARARGADVTWSRSWERSFDDARLRWLLDVSAR